MTDNYIRVSISIGRAYRHLYGNITEDDFERIKRGENGMFTIVCAWINTEEFKLFPELNVKISKVETMALIDGADLVNMIFKY